MTVGERIRQKREELNLSQGDLAKKMNVSRQAVSKAELHDSYITTEKVRKFAKALECSESYLMGWTNDEEEAIQKLTEAYVKGSERKSISDEEIDLIQTYRTLSDEGKRQFILMLEFFKNQYKDK